jgi:uncharacterized protein (TIGR03000 family)
MVTTPATTTPAGGTTKPEGGKEEVNAPAPATIIVTLPAEAKLLIDNAPTTSTSNTRVFVSPSLTPGKEFHYELKAEVVRDGKTVTAAKTVAVRAGAETRVQIDMPEASLAQK